MKQVNNLIIKFNRTYEKYQVIAPGKRVLEEFDTMEQAIECAKGITDFKKIQKKEKITDIDSLCEAVNNKYNLKRNEIGSIEHYSDMSENSIVQIANQYRGHIQLAYGDNKTLVKYLQGILEDRIKLKILEA
jgi:hypothetical protein